MKAKWTLFTFLMHVPVRIVYDVELHYSIFFKFLFIISHKITSSLLKRLSFSADVTNHSDFATIQPIPDG